MSPGSTRRLTTWQHTTRTFARPAMAVLFSCNQRGCVCVCVCERERERERERKRESKRERETEKKRSHLAILFASNPPHCQRVVQHTTHSRLLEPLS